MMRVNVHQAKTHLSRLLQEVEAGEEVVICRAGNPVARLLAVTPDGPLKRELGRYRGRIWMSEDFDDELPKDILDRFYGPGDED